MGEIHSDDLLALQRTVHTVIKALEQELDGLGLTASETNLLGCLGTEPERLRALVAATGQRPSTLTSVVDRLEQRGLVERRVDKRDRRSFQLVLTREGKRVRARVHGAYSEVAERVSDQAGTGPGLSFRETLDALDRGARREQP